MRLIMTRILWIILHKNFASLLTVNSNITHEQESQISIDVWKKIKDLEVGLIKVRAAKVH